MKDIESQGSHPYNAGMLVDYKKKHVSFYYPQRITKKNDEKGYTGSHLFLLLGMLGGYGTLCWLAYAHWIELLIIHFTNGMNQLLQITQNNTLFAQIAFMIATTIVLLGGLIWGAYFIMKVWIHACKGLALLFYKIPNMAAKYPEHNALLSKWKQKYQEPYVVQFNQKIGKKHYIENNSIIYFDYNVILTEYKMRKKYHKHLTHFETRFVGDKKEKADIETDAFVAIWTFDKLPTSGKLHIWS